MGCGQAKNILDASDKEKSEIFVKLVNKERNVLAVKLNKYFQDLVSECQYRAQGNYDGYQRMLNARSTMWTVNQNVSEAQKQGRGKTPLTLEGVNEIVELFLGHVMVVLKQRKWNGSFNYHMNHYGDVNAAEEAKRQILDNVRAGQRAANADITLVDDQIVTDVELERHQGFLDIVGDIHYPSLENEEEYDCQSECRFLFFVVDALVD